MNSVLVLADSPDIDALLADLVLFAGYLPVFARADESPGDTMLRRRIDVLLIDACIAESLQCSCTSAAQQRGTVVVYFASTMSEGELRAYALVRQSPHFALPNGPKLLASVLGSALAAAGVDSAPTTHPPAHIVVALHAVAQSRRLGWLARTTKEENERLRQERGVRFGEARASRDLLRAAAIEYLHELRRDGLPPQRALELISAAVRDGAEAIGVPELVIEVEREAEVWVGEAYYAA